MAALVEAIHGNTSSSSSSSTSLTPVAPLSVQTLDSLTVHTKMSLIHNIVTHIMKVASSKSLPLAPALVETYARLLVYMEIESLGIKGFICKISMMYFLNYSMVSIYSKCFFHPYVWDFRLFRMVNSFYLKQFQMLIFQFLMRNSNFVTFSLKNTTLLVKQGYYFCTIRKRVKW
jgi:hypothetical protein